MHICMTYVMCFTFFEYKVYVKYLMVFVDIKMLKSLSQGRKVVNKLGSN